MRALAEAGLFGLQVPTQLCSHCQYLLALMVLTESIANAAPYQPEHYLQPIAQGKHVTTLEN